MAWFFQDFRGQMRNLYVISILIPPFFKIIRVLCGSKEIEIVHYEEFSRIVHRRYS